MTSLLCVDFAITVEYIKTFGIIWFCYIALGLNGPLQLSGSLSAKHHGKYILKLNSTIQGSRNSFLLLLLNIDEYS